MRNETKELILRLKAEINSLRTQMETALEEDGYDIHRSEAKGYIHDQVYGVNDLTGELVDLYVDSYLPKSEPQQPPPALMPHQDTSLKPSQRMAYLVNNRPAREIVDLWEELDEEGRKDVFPWIIARIEYEAPTLDGDLQSLQEVVKTIQIPKAMLPIFTKITLELN